MQTEVEDSPGFKLDRFGKAYIVFLLPATYSVISLVVLIYQTSHIFCVSSGIHVDILFGLSFVPRS